MHKEDWNNWQSDIDTWAAAQGEEQKPPTESASDIHNAETASRIPQVIITAPSNLSSFSMEERLHDVYVEVTDEGNGVDRVEFYVNDALRYTSPEYPYNGRVAIPTTAGEGTILDIKAKVIDQYGYSSDSTIQVRLIESGEDTGYDEEHEEESDGEEEEEEVSILDILKTSEKPKSRSSRGRG